MFAGLRDVGIGFDGDASHRGALGAEDAEGAEAFEVAELRVELVGGDVGGRVAVEELAVDVVLEDEPRRAGRIGVSLSSGEESSCDCGQSRSAPRTRKEEERRTHWRRSSRTRRR